MTRFLFLILTIISMQIFAQKDVKLQTHKDSLLKDTVGPYYQKLADNLNKVVDDFPNNFNTIKGKKVVINSKMTTWYSKVTIPECEQGVIYQEPAAGFDKWVYKARLIRKDDKQEPIKLYKDFLKKLRLTKLNCCIMELKENVDYMGDYIATWHTLMLLENKNKAFKSLAMSLRYHEPQGDEKGEVYLYIMGSDE
jgi:hypothetical protein